jgi:hypothetical protein
MLHRPLPRQAQDAADRLGFREASPHVAIRERAADAPHGRVGLGGERVLPVHGEQHRRRAQEGYCQDN